MIKKIIFLVSVCVFSSTAWAQVVLKTNLQDSTPKYIQNAGVFSGLGIDIMKAIEKIDSGIKFTYPESFIPFARISSSLETGAIDVFFGMVKSEEREKQFVFVNPPLYATHNKMVVRKDDPIANIKSYNDIRALGADGIILVDFGTAHQKLLENEKDLRIDASGKNRKENLLKLMNKRGRFYYSTDMGLIGTIKEENLENKVRFLPHVFLEDFQYAAFSKSVPAATVLRVQKAIEMLSKNGELTKIRAKYVPEN
jgi:polar amino acid transport system substrate-binding protein